ncbi:MAG: mechanosensitive ion channel family protein [Desulfonatronovibrionaceae bacterium]
MSKASCQPIHLLVLSILFFCFLFPAHPAWAQQDTLPENPDRTRENISQLLNTLEDPARLEQLKQDLKLLLEASAGPEEQTGSPASGALGQLFSVISNYIASTSHVLAETAQDLLELPALLQKIFNQAKDPEVLWSWAEMTGQVLLTLLAGFLARMAVCRLLTRVRRTIREQKAPGRGLRILLVAGDTLFALIAVAAFAAAAYGVLPLLDPSQPTRLVTLTLINASIIVQGIMTFSGMILVPGSESLRLLPLDKESGHYLHIWIRRTSRTVVYGFFLLEAFLILGLPQNLYVFLLKLLGLVISLMFIILIMQNKISVSSWLRALKKDHPEQASGKKSPASGLSTLLLRLADFWHMGAVLIILGMYIVWSLDIEGGFFFLIRSLVLTAVMLILAGAVNRISQQGVFRLFKISEELKREYPGLEARANRYLPLLRHFLTLVVYLLVFFSIMQIWGIGALSWMFSPHGGALVSNLATIVFIIAAALVFWEAFSVKAENYLARQSQDSSSGRTGVRIMTLLPLLKNVIRIAIILVAGMSILSQLGINIAPLLAGAGVVGLAVGFGAQTLVKDVISGAFILLEDSISVGDWVEAGGHSGTVENLTIRTLTLRDLTGTVQVIPFGDVSVVKNYNRDYGYALIDAGVAYREDYGQVIQALQDVAAKLQQDPLWAPDIIGDLEVFGLNNLADSAVEIRVRIKTRPGKQFSIRRAFLEKMKMIFDERGIEIPFPHQTIWFGEDKNGSAPPVRLLQESSQPEGSEPLEHSAPQAPPAEIQYTSEDQASKDVVADSEENSSSESKNSRPGRQA